MTAAALAWPVRAITRGWWRLPLVGAIAAALCVPFLHTIFSFGDEGVLLHGAMRMLRGETLYADFFEFLPPAGFILTEAWLGIFGPSLLSARLLAVATVAGIACFTWLASERVTRNPLLSAGLALGWVVMSQGLWTQVSHHWLTTMLSMAGFLAVLRAVEDERDRSLWPMFAGLAFGGASMVTTTCGALSGAAGLVVFMMRRHRHGLIGYVLSGAVVPACMVLYLIGHGALTAAFEDVVLFAMNQYASIQVVPYGEWANGQNLPLKFAFPAGAALVLILGVRDRRALARDRFLFPCVAFAVAGFAGCFPRPDMSHIAFQAPLAAPLLGRCAVLLTRAWRPAFRYGMAGVFAGALVPAFVLLCGFSLFIADGERFSTPRGQAAYHGLDGAAGMVSRIAALPAGDKVFFYPFMPLMPYLSGREHVSKYDLLMPILSLPEQYREACVSVMREARWVVIDRTWTDPVALRHAFPALRDARPPETVAFEHALEAGFTVAARDGSFELRERQAGAREGLCAGVDAQ